MFCWVIQHHLIYRRLNDLKKDCVGYKTINIPIIKFSVKLHMYLLFLQFIDD